MLSKQASSNLPIPDLTNPDDYASAQEYIRSIYRLGITSEEQGTMQLLELEEYKWLDLMAQIIRRAITIVLGTDPVTGEIGTPQHDISFRDLLNLALSDLPFRPSSWQLRMIYRAIANFDSHRQKVKNIRRAMGQKSGARILRKVGVLSAPQTKSCDIDFDFHPSAIVLHLDDSAYVGAFLGGVSAKTEPLVAEKAGKTIGFYNENSTSGYAFNKYFCFVRALPDGKKDYSTATHETAHAEYSLYYDPGLYPGSGDLYTRLSSLAASNKNLGPLITSLKEIGIFINELKSYRKLKNDVSTLVALLKNMKNELVAYMRENDYQYKDKNLMPNSIDEQHFHHEEIRDYLKSIYNCICFELKRLENIGYKARSLFLTILTSHTLEQAIGRLRLIGRLEAAEIVAEVQRIAGDECGLWGNNPSTLIPISPEQVLFELEKL